MARSDSQSPYPREWQVLYRAAIFEPNSCVIAKRLSAAEKAIVERTRELFQESGANVEGEREALDDALYALKALKVARRTHVRPERLTRPVDATRSVGGNLCCSSVAAALRS
jgi:hypothetical protein